MSQVNVLFSEDVGHYEGPFSWQAWTSNQVDNGIGVNRLSVPVKPQGPWFNTLAVYAQPNAGGPGISGTGIFTLETTFEGLGVPAGSTVTGIIGGTLQTECFQSKGGGHGTVNPATLSDGTTVYALTGGRSFSTVEHSPITTSAGPAETGLALPSNTPITLHLSAFIQNGTQAQSDIGVYMTKLAFSVDYTPPA